MPLGKQTLVYKELQKQIFLISINYFDYEKIITFIDNVKDNQILTTKKNLSFLNEQLFQLLLTIANNPNNINFKKQMNQEISQFISNMLFINSLQCPNNYNMVEYIIGEQLMKLQQDQIKNIQIDVKEQTEDDYYQITKNNQNIQIFNTNQSQSDELPCSFEYIDYKIEEKLNEPQLESDILDSIPITNNEVEFQSKYDVDQFSTFAETHFLTNYKFILKQQLDSKSNNFQIRTSVQNQ